MAELFHLPIGASNAETTGSGFAKYGIEDNPFPDAGIDSGLLFYEHMVEELRKVNAWISRVQKATEQAKPASVSPLAIFGSLGVGKTHLLRYLERGLQQNPLSPVVRKSLAEEGVTRLVLANLFLRYVPTSREPDAQAAGLVGSIVEAAKKSDKPPADILEILGSGSPIERPLDAIFRKGADADAVLWFGRWLRRENTSVSQRMKIGLAGTLESEGQAIRAVTDLLRVARHVGLIQIWFIMIDQIEELWRENVVTPARRARFLTDLRLLIDQALEGAPVAVLLAWNTTTAQTDFGPDVSQQMRVDYQALWERLGPPIDIPQLSEQHVWPFAETYLKAAGVRSSSKGKTKELYDALKSSSPTIIEKLGGRTRARGPTGRYAPRAVLAAWRQMAETIASGSD